AGRAAIAGRWRPARRARARREPGPQSSSARRSGGRPGRPAPRRPARTRRAVPPGRGRARRSTPGCGSAPTPGRARRGQPPVPRPPRATSRPRAAGRVDCAAAAGRRGARAVLGVRRGACVGRRSPGQPNAAPGGPVRPRGARALRSGRMRIRRTAAAALLVSTLLVGCGSTDGTGDEATDPPTGEPSTAPTSAGPTPTPGEPGDNATDEPSPGPGDLPGEPVEGGIPLEGADLGVVGVVAGGVLNVRAGPGSTSAPPPGSSRSPPAWSPPGTTAGCPTAASGRR